MPLFGRPSREDDERAAAYGEWLRARHPYAIASLVLGVFSLIEGGVLIVFGVGGIACGVIALKGLRRANPPYTHGVRLAWTGIVLSCASLLIAAYLYSKR